MISPKHTAYDSDVLLCSSRLWCFEEVYRSKNDDINDEYNDDTLTTVTAKSSTTAAAITSTSTTAVATNNKTKRHNFGFLLQSTPCTVNCLHHASSHKKSAMG